MKTATTNPTKKVINIMIIALSVLSGVTIATQQLEINRLNTEFLKVGLTTLSLDVELKNTQDQLKMLELKKEKAKICFKELDAMNPIDKAINGNAKSLECYASL